MPPTKRRTSSPKGNGSFVSRDERDVHTFAPWSKTIEENCRFYETSVENGLSDVEILKRREKFGPNELTKAKGKSLLKMVLEQLELTLIALDLPRVQVGML